MICNMMMMMLIMLVMMMMLMMMLLGMMMIMLVMMMMLVTKIMNKLNQIQLNYQDAILVASADGSNVDDYNRGGKSQSSLQSHLHLWPQRVVRTVSFVPISI